MSILWCVSQKTNVRILRQAENRLVDRDAASELMKNYTLSFPVIEPSDGKRRVTARLGDRVLCSQETQFLAFSSVHLRQLRACSNAHPPPPAAPSCQVTVSLSPPSSPLHPPVSCSGERRYCCARGAGRSEVLLSARGRVAEGGGRMAFQLARQGGVSLLLGEGGAYQKVRKLSLRLPAPSEVSFESRDVVAYGVLARPGLAR